MKDLTKGNTLKTFLIFAIPLVLGGVLSQGYNLVDTIIAGKMLGDTGLAAIGATGSFVTLISSVLWGFGGGYAVYIARLFGSKDFKKMKNCIVSGGVFISLSALIMGIVLFLIKDPIFDLLKVDESIRKETFEYFGTYILGLFIIILNNFGFSIMNALGESTYPFFMSLISALLNILGNIISVAFLRMGVFGIAASSLFAAFVVDIFYIIRLRRCFAELGLGKERTELSFKYIKDSLPYAGPNTFQQTVLYIAGVIASSIINGMGAAATAGFIVITRIYDFCAQIYHNSAKTISNYTAQCVGAGKTDKIRSGVWLGIAQGCAFVLPVILLCMIFSEPVCYLFFDADAEREAVEIAVTFTKYFLPFIVFQLLCNVFHALFRGVKSTKCLFISTTIGAVSRIVLTFILARFYNMNGVLCAWVLSWVIETVYSLIIFMGDSWLPQNTSK
ncbi:MAG: polysaccharide biosynthesis C-terminal domain-containing protein [Clostridia bacterium]|nr:polysaccharide biosynthesis C-terminal domain-containing protein [Clostridia bacterium]